MSSEKPNRYIIAVKRDKRAEAPQDLGKSLVEIEGIHVCGGTRPDRVLVDATEDAVRALSEKFGDICHIEQPIEHDEMSRD